MSALTRTIIKAWLIVGTLDIGSAFLQYSVTTGKNPLRVLHSIASGVLGTDSFTMGTPAMLLGLILHYFIALSFTVAFFAAYPRIAFLRRNNLLTAFVYGVFIWSVMNLIVVPLSRIGAFPSNGMNAAIGLTILIICMGLPLALIASNYFRGRPSRDA